MANCMCMLLLTEHTMNVVKPRASDVLCVFAIACLK
jgi:hypothetical protein